MDQAPTCSVLLQEYLSPRRSVSMSPILAMIECSCFGLRSTEWYDGKAGNGAPIFISLDNPCGVVLDGQGYLFIVDRGNNRIVGSGPGGFRCIVGCTGTNGCASNQLLAPRRMSFDSVGSIFVVDGGNQRIQKFVLARNTCGESSHLVILDNDHRDFFCYRCRL